MGWFNAPVHLVRGLPIGLKLAITVVGALALLTGVSLFALNRLDFVTGLQEKVAGQSAVEHQVQLGLLAAQDLRVISRELQVQQTVAAVRTALNRATKQTGIAATLMHEVKAGPDQALLDDALVQLNALMGAVNKAADLRTSMLTARQVRLFRARPVFETSLTTLMTELARGGSLDSGVAAVRDTTAQTTQVDQHDPTLEAINRYRLAMSRLQASAMMFMVTDSGAAANDIRDATVDATASMALILSGPAPDAIKADARLVDNIGKSIAAASTDLIAMTRQLDQVAGADVETASQAMRATFERLAETAADRQRTASQTALSAGRQASDDILMMVGAITLLMVTLGTVAIRMLAGPIRRLTRIVQAIAGGKTDEAVPYTNPR